MSNIRVVRDYPHSPSKVWRALTDPELMALWGMRPEGFAPVVGTRYKLYGKPNRMWRGFIECEVLEVRAPELLRVSWVGSENADRTEVTHRLEARGSSTRLTSGAYGLHRRRRLRVRQPANAPRHQADARQDLPARPSRDRRDWHVAPGQHFEAQVLISRKARNMRKLLVFNQTSLDSFIADTSGDMSWAHKQDAEWNDWVAGNASGGGELLFGRVTYQQMASFWPTPMALERMPVVAERMNSAPKVVFSRTLAKAEWNNTRLIKSDIVAAVRKLKSEPGQGMVLMGSASIVSQLAQEGLIDSYQLVINPLILGSGKSMFEGLKKPVQLKHTSTRTFKNGNVVVSYERA